MNDKKTTTRDETLNRPALEEPSSSIAFSKSLVEGTNRTIPKIPNFSPPKLEPHKHSILEVQRPPTQEEVNKYQSASVFMRALADEAMSWKEQLPENYRPAILAFLYGGVQIHVHSLSQVSFHGIRIEGTLNGGPCSLLAHQSTVQMLCFGEEQTEERKSNPIGFIWDNDSLEV